MPQKRFAVGVHRPSGTAHR